MGERSLPLARGKQPQTSSAETFSHVWPWRKEGQENSNYYQEMTKDVASSCIIPSKMEYMNILREKRRRFMESHFPEELGALRAALLLDAEELDEPNREFVFKISKAWNKSHVESIAAGYFSDLGYRVSLDVQTGDFVKITLN